MIARCQVDYAGRLTAHLPMAPRLLMVKADGSVLVHADGGSYKPLNWMSPPCRLEESDGMWKVTNKAGEELRILIDAKIEAGETFDVSETFADEGEGSGGEVIDLMEALRASVEKSKAAQKDAGKKSETKPAAKKSGAKQGGAKKKKKAS